MAANRFPMEIWDHIMNFICEKEPQDAMKSLRNVCLTSRTLNVAGTPFLYRNLQATFDNETDRRLSAFLNQQPQLALHIKRICLTKSHQDLYASSTVRRILDATEPFSVEQEHSPNPKYYKHVALLFQLATQVQHISICSSHYAKDKRGDDIRYHIKLARQMQQMGYLRCLRSFEIIVKGIVLGNHLASEVVTEVMQIPMLEKVSFNLDTIFQHWYDDFDVTAGLRMVDLESRETYSRSSVLFIARILRACHALERLTIRLGRSQNEILTSDHECVRLPLQNDRLEVFRTSLRFGPQELFNAMLSHRQSLKFLSIDTVVFDGDSGFFSGPSLEQFTGLETLHVDTTSVENFGRSLNVRLFKRLMAPNLKRFTSTTYANPKTFAQTFGEVMQDVPKTLQTFEVTFIRYQTQVGFRKYEKFDHFTTGSFNLAIVAEAGWTPLLICSNNDVQKAISLCHSRSSLSSSNVDCRIDDGIPVSQNVRLFLDGSTVARELNKLSRMTTTYVRPEPVNSKGLRSEG